MQQIKIYTLITYLLLPFTLLIGISLIPMLLIALQSLIFMLPTFITACVAIYIISSLMFIHKGLKKGTNCNPALKDWIKVNAYVTIVFAVLTLMQSSTLIANKSILLSQLDAFYAAQQQPMPKTVNKELLFKILNGTLIFMMVNSALLIIHLWFSFKFLKQFNYLFEPKNNIGEA